MNAKNYLFIILLAFASIRLKTYSQDSLAKRDWSFMLNANFGAVALQKTDFSFGENKSDKRYEKGSKTSNLNSSSVSANLDANYKHFHFGLNYSYSETRFEGLNIKHSAYYTKQLGNHSSQTIYNQFWIQQNVNYCWSRISLKVGYLFEFNRRSTLAICILIPINYYVNETTNTTVQNPLNVPNVNDLSGLKTVKTQYLLTNNLHALSIKSIYPDPYDNIYSVKNLQANYSYYLSRHLAINSELNFLSFKMKPVPGIVNPYEISRTYHGFQSIYNLEKQTILSVNIGVLYKIY